jgi:hypothetical protein
VEGRNGAMGDWNANEEELDTLTKQSRRGLMRESHSPHV